MDKRALAAVSLAVLAAFVSAGCGKWGEEESPGKNGREIVRVGDIVLTEDVLENLLPEGERVPFTMDEKRRFVERWVETELLYQEAVRRGLKKDPRILARLRSLEQEFLSDHLVFLELLERTVVTDEEIEEYFRAHEKEYLYEYRVSHILLNTLEEAEEIKELLKTRSFTWVANRYSVDPVAKMGGDLGYLTKGNMIPEFENVIFDMKPGDVSDIVRSDFGYHIIRLVGMRESLVKVDLEDVREQIMNMLVIDKKERAYRDFLNSLKNSAEVEYYNHAYSPDSSVEEEADTSASEADTAGLPPVATRSD